MTPKTQSEKLALLQAWQDNCKANDKLIDALETALGASMADSPIFEQLYAGEHLHTNLLADVLGDGGEWLDYYRWECKLGLYSMTVWPDGDEADTTIELDSIESLLRVIEWGRESEGE